MEKRRSVNHKNNYKRTEYQYGSAVRKLNVAPELQPYLPSYDEEREFKRRKAQRKEIRRNSKINFMYTAIVAICASAVFFVCHQYLNLQSSIKTNSDRVLEMQTELSALKAENDLYEAEINSSVNFEEIYNTAVNELGMVYPSRSQVVDYDSAVSEYVRQYKDIK